MLGVEGSECDVYRIMLNSRWSRRKVYRTVIAVNGESGKLSGVKSGLYMPWLSHNGQSHGEQSFAWNVEAAAGHDTTAQQLYLLLKGERELPK